MKELIIMNIININSDYCKKCGICVEFCPAKVFTKNTDNTPVPQHKENCIGCRICELRCPDFAINVEVNK